MSKALHTPWEIKQDPTEYRLKAVCGKYEYEPNEFASVWIARELSDEIAKLIVSAPDLLEALQSALPYLHKETRIKAEEAIKKATE